MNDAFLVRRFQRVTDLFRNKENFINGQCATFSESVGQRVALDKFEHKEASRAALLKVVDSGDVLVIQRG